MNKNKRPTIACIAKQAHLSVATVDRVLNARAPVSPETAQRVFEAAEAIGYYAAHLFGERIKKNKPNYHLGFLLLGTSQEFYQNLSEAITEEARNCSKATVTCHIDYIFNRSPLLIASQINQLAEQCHGMALVCFDHPLISQAVEHARQKGVHVVSLLSDISSQMTLPYVGLDNWEVGRTAGWLIAQGSSSKQGSVGMLLGGHRFLGHEARKAGLKSFFQEKAPGFQVLEPIINMDNEAVTEEATLELLSRHPDLRGIYVAGGGNDGVLSALALTPEPPPLCIILNESTRLSRQALRQELISLVIDSQPALLAKAVVDLLVELPTSQQSLSSSHQALIPLQILTPENV
ncbi:LacI family DNA-binding transcriptional regulator [Pseudomonas luteola]|uniref:LacI family DNA-binding transcriptional regulator n=1 Tax=Pseudomonas luteola TaxID=47886 RepID=UPI000F7AA544|nr:LacI family DNA-binding transcriptional regulator [Pseudomonas luteola]RRW40400.1 LacI family DNA-binding transcriptional regulator [Pseudomonas luteola]